MFKYLIISLLLFNCSISYSQTFNGTLKSDFAWHVKQIDEFIERFDNKDETLIKLYNKSNDNVELTRERLLISLFNSESKNWNIKEIKSFIKEIDDRKRPVYLKFFDENWCANLTCSVTWKGRPERVLLTLKIIKFPDESSKWVITGVNATFLRRQRLLDSSAHNTEKDIPRSKDHTTSLHPYSHATSFMNIDQVSKDKLNIENYFQAPANPFADEMLVFVNEIVKNRLIINNPVTLCYYFYQVKGWAFEVSQFDRESRNSGWLISKLIKIQPQKKSTTN